MAHKYGVGVAKATSGVVAQMIANIVAGTPRAEIRQIEVYLTTAVAAEVLLGRPAATGTGGVTTQLLAQAYDPNDAAAGTNVITAYTTLQATAPTIPYKRIQLPGNIGAGVIWIWGPGEMIVTSALAGQLILYQNSTANAAFDVNVELFE